MTDRFGHLLRKQCGGRCEYCRLPESTQRLKHVLDHVIARQHGGKTELANLALCCGRCNRFKGPNVAGVDPSTRQIVRLFHPRTDSWGDHFQYQDAILHGKNDIGRATIAALAINLPIRVAARNELIVRGTTFRVSPLNMLAKPALKITHFNRWYSERISGVSRIRLRGFSGTDRSDRNTALVISA